MTTPPPPVVYKETLIDDIHDIDDEDDKYNHHDNIVYFMTDNGIDSDQVTTMKDFMSDSRVIKSDDVFDPDSSLPKIMPEREKELNEIHLALAPVARGSSPKNRLIFGKPGQGKTAAVQLKQNQMQKQLADRESIQTNSIYVSCKENPSSYDVAQTILKRICDYDHKPKGYQLSELYDKIYTAMGDIGGAFIIILDEIDSIQARKSKYDEENEPNILYKFPRSNSNQLGMNDDDPYQIGLFGISNDREFRKNLTSRCMDALGETTINFKPYNKTQLTHILMRRATRGLKHTKLDISESGKYDFKSDVISEEQLRECANMAARERGSARQALQYLGGAAMIADNVGANQITTDHIRKSEQKVRQEFVQDILTDHTRDDLLTFCGVLWCVANDSTPTKAAAIHNNYSSVCSVLDERSKVQRRMTERLKDLDLTGAIEMSKETGGQRGGEYFVIELSLPFVETLDVMQHEDPFAEKFSVIIEEIRDNAERNDVI